MAAARSNVPRKLPRQERSRATVDTVLDAAAHILVNDGYEGFNTNRVAERAGVSIGSLYQYFPNKAALLTALRQRHAQEMSELVGARTHGAAQASLKQAIEQVVAGVIEAHRLHPRLHQVLEQEVPRQTQQASPTDWEAGLRLQLMGLLAQHREQLAVSDLSTTSLVLIRLVDALVHAALIPDPQGVPAAAIEGEISTVVWRYLTGRR